jgi:hypothetical protein
MDLDGQIKLGHLLLQDRKCRSCGEVKNLVESFYRTSPIKTHFLINISKLRSRRIKTWRLLNYLPAYW